MRVVLHILTRPADRLAEEIVGRHRQSPDLDVRTFDLTGDNPDYRALLEGIFEADSIEVW